MQTYHQEQLDDTELATWHNYRMLLHAIFEVPKKERTKQDKSEYSRQYRLQHLDELRAKKREYMRTYRLKK